MSAQVNYHVRLVTDDPEAYKFTEGEENLIADAMAAAAFDILESMGHSKKFHIGVTGPETVIL